MIREACHDHAVPFDPTPGTATRRGTAGARDPPRAGGRRRPKRGPVTRPRFTWRRGSSSCSRSPLLVVVASQFTSEQALGADLSTATGAGRESRSSSRRPFFSCTAGSTRQDSERSACRAGPGPGPVLFASIFAKTAVPFTRTRRAVFHRRCRRARRVRPADRGRGGRGARGGPAHGAAVRRRGHAALVLRDSSSSSRSSGRAFRRVHRGTLGCLLAAAGRDGSSALQAVRAVINRSTAPPRAPDLLPGQWRGGRPSSWPQRSPRSPGHPREIAGRLRLRAASHPRTSRPGRDLPGFGSASDAAPLPPGSGMSIVFFIIAIVPTGSDAEGAMALVFVHCG